MAEPSSRVAAAPRPSQLHIPDVQMPGVALPVAQTAVQSAKASSSEQIKFHLQSVIQQLGLAPSICKRSAEDVYMHQNVRGVVDWAQIKKAKLTGSRSHLLHMARERAGSPEAVGGRMKSKQNKAAGSSGRTYTSRFRGVHQTFPTRRWEAQFRRSGKPTSLGCFDKEEEAARAYDKMMLWCELHAAGGVKATITNFDLAEYERDISWLSGIQQDELIETLRSEGRKQATHRGGAGFTKKKGDATDPDSDGGIDTTAAATDAEATDEQQQQQQGLDFAGAEQLQQQQGHLVLPTALQQMLSSYQMFSPRQFVGSQGMYAGLGARQMVQQMLQLQQQQQQQLLAGQSLDLGLGTSQTNPISEAATPAATANYDAATHSLVQPGIQGALAAMQQLQQGPSPPPPQSTAETAEGDTAVAASTLDPGQATGSPVDVLGTQTAADGAGSDAGVNIAEAIAQQAGEVAAVGKHNTMARKGSAASSSNCLAAAATAEGIEAQRG